MAICCHERTCCKDRGFTAVTSSKALGGTKLAMTLYEENTGGFLPIHNFHINSLEEDYEKNRDIGRLNYYTYRYFEKCPVSISSD